MVAQLIFSMCAVMVLVQNPATAQWSFEQAGTGRAWGQPNFGFNWGSMPQRNDRPRFQTCIGKNINGDEMRATFSEDSNNDNVWGNRMGNIWGNSARPRLTVVVSAGQSSTLYGQYRLVVTTGSRVAEGCSNVALGEILSDRARTWWGQPQTAKGVVGNVISIAQGHTVTSSESLQQLTLEEVRGHGLALCRADQVSGNTCVGLMPLCCKIGYDSEAATTPFNVQGQLHPQAGLGFQNPGTMGGMNQGLGVNQGFGGVLSQGMNQGGLSQGVNQGMAQGLPTGINTGLGQNANPVGPQGLSF